MKKFTKIATIAVVLFFATLAAFMCFFVVPKLVKQFNEPWQYTGSAVVVKKNSYRAGVHWKPEDGYENNRNTSKYSPPSWMLTMEKWEGAERNVYMFVTEDFYNTVNVGETYQVIYNDDEMRIWKDDQ